MSSHSDTIAVWQEYSPYIGKSYAIIQLRTSRRCAIRLQTAPGCSGWERRLFIRPLALLWPHNRREPRPSTGQGEPVLRQRSRAGCRGFLCLLRCSSRVSSQNKMKSAAATPLFSLAFTHSAEKMQESPEATAPFVWGLATAKSAAAKKHALRHQSAGSPQRDRLRLCQFSLTISPHIKGGFDSD